eukprot:NODE_23_length_38171_cov_0.318108.p9 type:complete len:403 gc:universal NODE_23_length_38171_cov_0.318108:20654-19446(-)
MSSLNRTAKSVSSPSDDDVVIVCALRTAITRAKKGGFKDTPIEELLDTVLRGVLEKSRIKPDLVEEVTVGTVCSPSGGAMVSRMAVLSAGFPITTSVSTVNRQCSSGLQAVASVAHAIKAGDIDIGIGAGVESMTKHYMVPGMLPESFSERVSSANKAAQDTMLPMGMTSDTVAAEFKVSREKQDQFAALSHSRALKAQKDGLFKDEIVPAKVLFDGNTIVVTDDDGIRPGTTPEKLAKLRPAFGAEGTTTAGNASQVSDGASAVLLMRRSIAKKLGLKPIAKFVCSAVVGVPPHIMGVGPAFAIPAALKKAGLTVADVDIFEINEAFASQSIYCVEKLKIPIEKVNVKGGAIALGHPLGCTGSRQIATLLPELKRQGKKVGVTSMCIGTGMGMASVIYSEQ